MPSQEVPVTTFPVTRAQLFGTALPAGSDPLDVWQVSVDKLFRHAQNAATAMNLVFASN